MTNFVEHMIGLVHCSAVSFHCRLPGRSPARFKSSILVCVGIRVIASSCYFTVHRANACVFSFVLETDCRFSQQTGFTPSRRLIVCAQIIFSCILLLLKQNILERQLFHKLNAAWKTVSLFAFKEGSSQSNKIMRLNFRKFTDRVCVCVLLAFIHLFYLFLQPHTQTLPKRWSQG